MKCLIVGAGALGRLLGALLSEGGQDVIFLDPDQDVVDAINQKGIGLASSITPDPTQMRYLPAQALTNVQLLLSKPDLIFLTTKSYHTATAISQICHLVGPDAPLITLQNGLGHLNIISKSCDPGYVISGFTNLAATALGPGEVINDSQGLTYLGWRQPNNSDKLKEICVMLTSCGIATEEVTDIVSRRWQRALVHGAINPVSAILRCRNKQLITNLHTMALLKRLIDEGRDIALARGIELGEIDLYDMLMNSCQQRADHLSPMLQDILNGRKTEIESLNGMLCQYAHQTGVKADTQQSVYEIIKGLEQEMINTQTGQERF